MEKSLTDTSLTPGRGTAHNPSLVVEVAECSMNINNASLFKYRLRYTVPQNNKYASTFFTKNIFDGRPDIVESNICRASSG
jgi:hypothetical protein